jgi:hypothetical protein
MADELLTTRQVMARLGVKHPDKVLELVHAKLLPAINIGTAVRATWRYRPADVDAFLTSRRVGPLPAKPQPSKALPVPMRDTLKRLISAGHV